MRSSEQAKGIGYAISTSDELKFMKDIAASTGVILDPVYRSEYEPCTATNIRQQGNTFQTVIFFFLAVEKLLME